MKTFFRFIRVFMLAATIASILWCSVGTIVFLTIINSITWGITGYTEGIEAHT